MSVNSNATLTFKKNVG